MASRYRNLTAYSWLVGFTGTAWLGYELGYELPGVALPPWWGAALCIAACLFVFQFGVRAPRVGLISMERVPQFGMVLVLGAAPAAAIAACASLLWPLVNRRYSQGSRTVGWLRGVHNAGMTALMLLLAGKSYLLLGGSWPLRNLSFQDLLPLLAMALVAQVANIGLMAFYFKLDGRELNHAVTPSYALSDLIFVPAGVLAAILFNSGQAPVFALFVGLMALFVLSFNAVGYGSHAQNGSGPLAKLFQARRALQGARNIGELGRRVAAEARALVRFDEFHLALVDREALQIRVHERYGKQPPEHGKPLQTGLFAAVIERRQSLLIQDRQQAPTDLQLPAEPTGRQAGSLMVVPLLDGAVAVGALALQHAKPGIFSKADLHLIERLAEEAAVAVANARAFEDAENYRQRLEQRVTERTAELEQANRDKERLIAALRERSLVLERETQEDPLTGIANRRCFMQRLAAEFEVAAAVGQPLTLAIADIDYFKNINDKFGHRLGDEALRRCAQLLRAACRSTDLPARIGGEEFAVLLPGTACAAALQLCEALRQSVQNYAWRDVHPELQLTISVGIWQWNGRSSAAELLHAADEQLYQAKRGGRNRVA
jgi:diguanylate cyclase (GGDEF)-like protein